jgi:uncharacterized protein (DUF2062 family)
MPLRVLRHRYKFHRRQFRRFFYHSLLHADDPPHRLALGVAVGVFVAFTPTVGVQMLLAGFLCWVLSSNKIVGAAAVWVSNPATIIPIYWSSYRVGCALLARKPIGHKWWSELAHPPAGWWISVTFYWSRFMEIAGPLWLGGIIAGLICAYPTYLLTLRVVQTYRIRRARRRRKGKGKRRLQLGFSRGER